VKNRGWRARAQQLTLACASVAAETSAARADPAIGQFEIKSLSAEAGEVEFQSQNAFFVGSPRRRVKSSGGEIHADDNTVPRQRHGLELEVGLSRFLKTRVGVEYERERIEDILSASEAHDFGAIELDEYEAEAVVILFPRSGDGWGLGMVIEYEHPSESAGAKTLAAGPIVEFARGPWITSFNPTLIQFMGGERNVAGELDEKIDLSYTGRILYRHSEHLDLALEAYGTFERVDGRGARSDAAQLFGDFDQHRVGPVAYWSVDAAGVEAEAKFGFGALFGLNDDTADVALKTSFELTF